MTNFKPMLAKDGDPSNLSYPQLAQIKLDGVRATVVNGRLVSRTLKAIPNAEIRSTLERPWLEGLDGELIVGNPTATDCYRKTASFVMSESKTDEPWTFYVFDKWDEPDRAFGERYESLVSTVQIDNVESRSRVQIVPCAVVPNYDALEALELSFLAEGYEGVILRDPLALYKFGRSGKKGPLIKVKRFVDFEAEVIGVYEEMHNGNVAKTNELGRTERSSHAAGKIGKGTLGGLELRALNGPAEGVKFRCGTGFDAEQRRTFWDDYDDGNGLNGLVAKIKSFPIGVKDKPRHPVFLGWRDMEVDG